jgi:hypothetical protein
MILTIESLRRALHHVETQTGQPLSLQLQVPADVTFNLDLLLAFMCLPQQPYDIKPVELLGIPVMVNRFLPVHLAGLVDVKTGQIRAIIDLKEPGQ